MRRHTIRVVVADDNAPMRLGVRALLEERGFDVCADAVDAPSAVEAALREQPDICLLDIKMPGDGISAAEAIHAQLPETGIVILTASHDEADFVNSLRAGAAAYVVKDADPERLPDVLRGVVGGESSFPRELVSRLLAQLDRRKRRDVALESRGVTLTVREREIADLLAEGKTTAEIAAALFVAPVTVRSHVSAIVRKLGVGDRASAAELLRDLGSVDESQRSRL